MAKTRGIRITLFINLPIFTVGYDGLHLPLHIFLKRAYSNSPSGFFMRTAPSGFFLHSSGSNSLSTLKYLKESNDYVSSQRQKSYPHRPKAGQRHSRRYYRDSSLVGIFGTSLPLSHKQNLSLITPSFQPTLSSL